MGKRKERIGIVVSDRMEKSCVVKVEKSFRHPRYGKVIKKYKKFKVHDERDEARVGDKVLISETRPISKEKYFRLVKILKRAEE